MPPTRKRLSRVEFLTAANPGQVLLDAVIELIFIEDYTALPSTHQIVRLALVYDNEVCNGGHLQYFHNQGVDLVEDLLSALTEIGAECQRAVFEEASQYVLSHPVKRARTLEEYSKRARQYEFKKQDDSYYQCRPEIGNELLPNYIQMHIDDFIEFE